MKNRTSSLIPIIGAIVFIGLPLLSVVAYGIALRSAAQNLEGSTDAAGLSLDAQGRTMISLGDFEAPRKDPDATTKADANQSVTLRLSVGIAPDSPELEKEIAARRDELREAAGDVVNENGWSDSESVASRLAFRTALQIVLNKILESGEIQTVVFAEVVGE
ncbi:MAG: hypothetical protein NXI24_15940 [bacterium]|nr:hypothetical protein [bacterium]